MAKIFLYLYLIEMQNDNHHKFKFLLFSIKNMMTLYHDTSLCMQWKLHLCLDFYVYWLNSPNVALHFKI